MLTRSESPMLGANNTEMAASNVVMQTGAQKTQNLFDLIFYYIFNSRKITKQMTINQNLFVT